MLGCSACTRALHFPRSSLVSTLPGFRARCLSTASPVHPQSGPRHSDVVPDFRSMMFVPGDSEKKVRKSVSSGADLCCLDLEDGVALSQKSVARQNISSLLSALHTEYPSSTFSMIRLNAPGATSHDGQSDFAQDVAMLATLEQLPCAIALSKMDSARDVEVCMQHLAKVLPRNRTPLGIFLMVESPEGIVSLADICKCLLGHADEQRFLPGGLVFGHMDYCTNLGIDVTTGDRSNILYAEQAIATVAKAFRLQATDAVFTTIRDLDGLRADSVHAARAGFSSKCALHPAQVPVINEVFSPSEERIAWADGLLQAFRHHESHGQGVFVYQDQLVDAPVFRRARQTMAAAERRKT